MEENGCTELCSRTSSELAVWCHPIFQDGEFRETPSTESHRPLHKVTLDGCSIDATLVLNRPRTDVSSPRSLWTESRLVAREFYTCMQRLHCVFSIRHQYCSPNAFHNHSHRHVCRSLLKNCCLLFFLRDTLPTAPGCERGWLVLFTSSRLCSEREHQHQDILLVSWPHFGFCALFFSTTADAEDAHAARHVQRHVFLPLCILQLGCSLLWLQHLRTPQLTLASGLAEVLHAVLTMRLASACVTISHPPHWPHHLGRGSRL